MSKKNAIWISISAFDYDRNDKDEDFFRNAIIKELSDILHAYKIKAEFAGLYARDDLCVRRYLKFWGNRKDFEDVFPEWLGVSDLCNFELVRYKPSGIYCPEMARKLQDIFLEEMEKPDGLFKECNLIISPNWIEEEEKHFDSLMHEYMNAEKEDMTKYRGRLNQSSIFIEKLKGIQAVIKKRNTDIAVP